VRTSNLAKLYLLHYGSTTAKTVEFVLLPLNPPPGTPRPYNRIHDDFNLGHVMHGISFGTSLEFCVNHRKWVCYLFIDHVRFSIDYFHFHCIEKRGNSRAEKGPGFAEDTSRIRPHDKEQKNTVCPGMVLVESGVICLRSDPVLYVTLAKS
jgi:hypothetical protein